VPKEAPSQERLRLYEFGPFRLDPTERRLMRGHETVPLTPKAFDTLYLLVRNSGHVLEKDEMIRALWPDTFVEEGSLSNNVFLLRKALGDDPAFIERFPGEVTALPEPCCSCRMPNQRSYETRPQAAPSWRDFISQSRSSSL
jgi:DNA-binding response OmpR family regulator